MTDQLISYETALIAKEKRFYNYDTKLSYDKNGKIYYQAGLNKENEPLAHTQPLLQKWLRENHRLMINVGWVYGKISDIEWFFSVKGINRIDNNVLPHNELRFSSYEDALEVGLQEALKTIL